MPGGTARIAATHASALTGGRDDWRTPEVVLARVRAFDFIALDPCAAPDNPTGALETCYPTHPDPRCRDGRAVPWGDDDDAGIVFVNPPYSDAKAWAEKIATEAARGVAIVSLVAARPDSRWFFRAVWQTAQAACFWRGRLRFVGAPASAPFPSVVVYHGYRRHAFREAFADAGAVLFLGGAA